MTDWALPAVSAAPDVWAEVERAAAAAVVNAPEASRPVLGKLLKGVGKPPVANGPVP